MKQKMILGSIIFTAAFLFSGCGESIIEKAVESQTGGKIDIDSNEGKMTLKTDQGDISMSGDGNATLDPNFPKDIYIAPDAKIQFSMVSEQDKSYSAAYITDMGTDEIYTKYKDELAAKGWTSDPTTEISFENSKTILYKKGAQRLTVITGPSQDEQWNGKTSVQVIGAEDKTAN